MASYCVKLVDHTTDSDKLTPLIQKRLQELFTQVFDGTSDLATVAWGAPMDADQLVLHFVEDIAHSYINEKLPGKDIRGDAGGHTRTRGHATGSEFYKVSEFNGVRSQVRASGMAKLAFHEAMHNQTGLNNADLHGSVGGGGLAASPPQLPLSATNKTLMQQAMAKKTPQLL